MRIRTELHPYISINVVHTNPITPFCHGFRIPLRGKVAINQAAGEAVGMPRTAHAVSVEYPPIIPLIRPYLERAVRRVRPHLWPAVISR